MLHDMQVPIDEPLATPVNPEKHKETEGLVVALIYASSTMLPFSETYIPSKNYIYVSQSVSGSTPNIASARQSVSQNSYLSDILVSHSADLLDVCRALGHSLKGVAGEGQLILLALGDLDSDTTLHSDPAHKLLANEVSVHPTLSVYLSPARRLLFPSFVAIQSST